MKKILLSLIILVSFCIPSIRASHYMGVDMTYECLSPCTYRIHHKAYYDCSGAATAPMLPPNITTVPSLTFVGLPSGCTTFPQMIGTWNFVHNIEVTPVCPDSLSATACSGGNFINGVTEGYYYADFDFCVPAANPCSQFMVRFYNCCRNSVITSGAANEAIFVDMMMDLNLGLCNNSPVFNELASNYICAGQPAILDHSATDPDGDLLVYSLDVILSNDTVPINYLPGYDSLNFLGPDWAVSLNPSSGLISLTPNPTGGQEVGSFRIHVDEYRNGVHIGRISRDAQVTVISVGCQSNSQVSLSGIQNIDPTYWAPPDTILACAGINIGFDIIGTDVDTSNMVTVLSDIQNHFPGASTSLMGTNPTTYHVSFTPGPQQAGNIYDLSVVAESNGCLLGTYTTKNIKIIVKNSCLEYLSYPSNCNDSTGGVNITLIDPTPPVQYLWSNGDTTEDLSGVASGIYWVHATDATGKMYADTFVVDGIDMSIFTTIIQPDCNTKTGAILPNVSGGTAPYTFSWSSGNSTLGLAGIAAGGYTLYVIDANNCLKHETYILEEPDSCYVIVQGKAYMDVNGNCLYDSADYPLVNAFIDATPGGATFTDSMGNYTFWVDTGTVTISYNSSVFDPSGCSLGSSHTLVLSDYDDDTTGIDFPTDTTLLKDLKIDGAILGALTGGSFHQYHLTYRNEGVIPMNGTVTFTHDPGVTITSNPINASYDSATFTFTWNFSNLVPGQVKNIALTGTLPATTPTSTPVTTSISVNPVAGDYTPWNNSKTWTDTTAWPYDPNNKQVTPQGIGNPGFIQTTDSVLTYIIRFQNTGNFPANYVIIRDLIDTNLVISSFSARAFSHPYSVSAEEDQKLVFTFTNINLPDSASDPEGSQGFIQFSLKQKPNLPVGMQIKNKASIIFDFNPPIITNEVVNTIFTYPEIQLTEPEDSLCEDDLLWAMISKPAMPPYTYLWQPGEISHQSTAFMDSIPVKASGLHTVILIDSFGFSDTASVHVPVINYPVADFSFSANGLSVDFTNVSENGKNWLWQFGDGEESSEPNPSHQYPKSGAYEVVLISAGECGNDTLRREIQVASGNSATNFLESVRIAPNPFSDMLTISFYNPDLLPVELNVFDARGRRIIHHGPEMTESFTIENNGLAAGIYFIELIGNERFIGKVMVK